jgi:hypothetical protein
MTGDAQLAVRGALAEGWYADRDGPGLAGLDVDADKLARPRPDASAGDRLFGGEEAGARIRTTLPSRSSFTAALPCS